jgi:hypothetical protein
MGVRAIARRTDAISGSGEIRIHAGTATFEVRTNEVASPRRPSPIATWSQ